VFVVYCVGSGMWGELITGTEETYRVCACVFVRACDVENCTVRFPRPLWRRGVTGGSN
jgi:hypothetical protein